MRISFKIALRYLFSKKSVNIINIIAGISTIGVTIATAALIIILSVFNGLEEILLAQINSFNPELKISLNEGKYFEINDSIIGRLNQIDNIKNYAFVLEDYSAIKNGKITHPFPIKGVDVNYLKVTRVDTMLLEGDFKLKNDKGEYLAVVGYQISKKLSIGLGFVRPLVIYAPKRTKTSIINPSSAFNKAYLYPSGIFGVDESVNNIMLIDINLAQEILGAKNSASGIELSLIDKSLINSTKEKLHNILGQNFLIKDRKEQNSFYKIINSERLMIYLVLGFVMLIAAFNIVASLTMLIVDKKKDFISFQSIGLSDYQIKMIFLMNGWMTTILGAVIGLVLGSILAFIQMKYGIISFGNGFQIDAYPVAIKLLDFAKVFALVLLIGTLTSIIPMRHFKKQYLS